MGGVELSVLWMSYNIMENIIFVQTLASNALTGKMYDVFSLCVLSYCPFPG